MWLRSLAFGLVLLLAPAPFGSHVLVDPSGAAADHPVVRVVVTSYPPFAFRATDGTAQGFSIELLREIAQRADLTLQFQFADSIDAALARVTSGQADLIPSLASTPERLQMLNFTTPIAHSVVNLYARQGHAARFAEGNFTGARVGLVRSSATQALIEQLPGAVAVGLGTNDAVLLALADGEVDLAICGRDVFDYATRRLGLHQDLVAVGPPLRRLDLAIGVAPGHPELIYLLNGQIHDMMVEPTYRDLHDHWFGGAPGFWTASRILGGSAAVLSLVLIISGVLVWWQRELARRTLLAETRAREQLAVEYAQALALKNGDLERKNAELETLVRVVSHDLRSPMVTVRGFAEVLDAALRQGDLAEAADASSRILRSTRRLSDIADDMIDLSRIERGTLDLGLVDLAEICESVRVMLATQLQTAGARLVLAESACRFVADPRKATRVVLNLVANAISHGCPTPGMTITVSATQVWVGDGRIVTTICVRDQGPGIDPRHHRDIFELFRRLVPGQGGGTGLGLAIVEKIAQKHGGRAWVESTPGRGAAFFVEFAPAQAGQTGEQAA